MGKILNHITFTILFVLTTLCSCSDDGCIDNQSSIPLARFYSAETKSSIEVYGVGATGDSLLTTAGVETGETYLPFKSSQKNTAFCFHYTDFGATNVYNDTIWFEYESYPYFASEECGAMYRYKITSVRHTNIIIDSVEIIDPVINNVDAERIKIFFKTE